MKTWLAGDCNFQKRTKQKILNWNEVVQDEDTVLIFGNFCDDSISKEEILSQLNGRKVMVGMKDFENHKNFFCYVRNGQGVEFIYIIFDEEDYEKMRFQNADLVSARSITKQDKVWQYNTLSLSFDDWGDTPINYDEVPRLIENMKIFDKMGEEY